MKRILSLLGFAALGGCVVAPPPAPRMAMADPYQWHVVSVENVQRAPGSPAPATVVTSEPVYTPAPVYAAAPVVTYYPAYPVYAPSPYPYYAYPPVSIGLDLMFGFGHGCCWGGRGHYRHR
jgi:hypothetical protein